MHYEIKAFDKATGSALVRFWTDDYTAGLTYNVDIPIIDGSYIAGDALASHIMAFAPPGQIARLVEAAALDSTAIEALVTPPPEPSKTPEQVKAEQIAAIDTIRRDRLAGGFAHNGVSYPCDSIFQQQVTGFLAAWREGILAADATVTIRTFDDQLVQVGHAGVVALGAALMTYVQQVYAESWAAKDAL